MLEPIPHSTRPRCVLLFLQDSLQHGQASREAEGQLEHRTLPCELEVFSSGKMEAVILGAPASRAGRGVTNDNSDVGIAT